MSTDSDDIPRGLVVSGSRSTEQGGRIRRAVLAVLLLATAALVWPVYPAVSGIRPFVPGLPFSLAWVTGWLGVTFAALVVLYRSEPPGREAEDRPA